MKILGKYKDYYDYLQGIYGVDPLLVLDRRYDDMVIRHTDDENEDTLYIKSFFVSGKQYIMYYFNGISYYTLDELNQLNEILEHKKKETISMPWEYNKPGYWNSKERVLLTQEWWDDQNGKKSNINKKKRNPVLMCNNNPKTTRRVYGEKTEIEYFPCILSQWDFHKVMTAEEAYREVSSMMAYFVDNPAIPNKQTNIEKLLSHGFDKKKSFRHRK